MRSWYHVQDEENVHKCRFGEEEYKKFSLGGIKCKMSIRGIFKKPSKSGSWIYISWAKKKKPELLVWKLLTFRLYLQLWKSIGHQGREFKIKRWLGLISMKPIIWRTEKRGGIEKEMERPVLPKQIKNPPTLHSRMPSSHHRLSWSLLLAELLYSVVCTHYVLFLYSYSILSSLCPASDP